MNHPQTARHANLSEEIYLARSTLQLVETPTKIPNRTFPFCRACRAWVARPTPRRISGNSRSVAVESLQRPVLPVAGVRQQLENGVRNAGRSHSGDLPVQPIKNVLRRGMSAFSR